MPIGPSGLATGEKFFDLTTRVDEASYVAHQESCRRQCININKECNADSSLSNCLAFVSWYNYPVSPNCGVLSSKKPKVGLKDHYWCLENSEGSRINLLSSNGPVSRSLENSDLELKFRSFS